MMSASSSATTRTSLRSIPILVRYSAIKPIFLSLVRPDRISSPITRIPAVTISLMTSPRPAFVTLPRQHLEVTGFAAETSNGKPVFQAKPRPPIPNARRECISRWPGPCYHALEPCAAPHGLPENSRDYGSCVRRNERARRPPPSGLSGAVPLAKGDATGRPGISPPGSGAAVPPDRHHLCRLWRRRSPGAADSLRPDSADPGGDGSGGC